MIDDEISHFFADDGLLAQHIGGYSPRQQQQEMAEKVQQALQHSSVFIAEAGTGTGKTFAYLAPAIMSGQKVFISTGTKNLQDQLFSKDIPLLRKAISTPFQATLLKGRSNYLCHHRLSMAESDPLQQHYADTLHELRVWTGETRTGDLSEVDILEDNSTLWPKVTSTVDNCLGQNCPDYEECFISEARKKAQESDIVVINHHLLMSDFALKASGQGEVLPSADAFIIDEAHQLPAVASQFLGQRVSSHQIQELCRDTVREMTLEAADMDELRQRSTKVESALHTLKVACGDSEQRLAWSQLGQRTVVKDKLSDLISELEILSEQLESASERGKGLEQCFERSKNLLLTLDIFTSQNDDDDTTVLWADLRSSSFVFHATPFDVSDYFHQWMEEKPTAWVFTSATLTVAGKFNSFTQQLGIENADSAIWQSPFDYAKQSLLYMPSIPVEPNNSEYNSHIVDIAKDVIAHSKGRTFLLFTSYKSMHEVAEALEDEGDYPLLVQGSASKMRLLEQFKQLGNAVLLGTSSFWEGVDVRGEALSCVLIDKIPFASPGDPVLQARIDALRSRGGNPFSSIQIPSAVIQLKQGIGRLIRDTQDSGVLVLCDPRFLTKPYGKVFLRSLPAMPITQDIAQVEQFFNEEE
jgi:ATP-dependent DNA helicase DinG